MRPRVALGVLLAGLLAGGMFAAGATPALARPEAAAKGRTTLTARLAPPVVTEGEPAAVVATLSPAQAAAPVNVEQRVGDTWIPVADGTAVPTDAAGRVVVPLETSVVGSQTLRISSTASKDRPSAVLKVVSNTVCSPKTPLVDPDATPEAICLATRLERWGKAGLMGVGQELNMSTYYADYSDPPQSGHPVTPLTALGGRRVSVVGFDLMELNKSKTYQYPFYDQGLAYLVAQAQAGAVLTASWHARNPHTQAPDSFKDRKSWHQLGDLLKPGTAEATSFWADYDAQLEVLSDLQDQHVAVVFRPLHEANGDWFWWGKADPATYRAVYLKMQRTAWKAGIHNVLWSYSFAAADRKGIAAPETMLPRSVDVAGIDSYYPGHQRSQVPSMAGYAAVAARVPRMTFSEIGPLKDTTPRWQASAVTKAARAAPVRKPLWAMLWVDDTAGKKQISSLAGGFTWLDSCPFGFCQVS